MALLRALIAGPPSLNRHMLSKEFCRRIGWCKRDGGVKDYDGQGRHAGQEQGRPQRLGRRRRDGRTGPGSIGYGTDTEAPLFQAQTTLVRGPSVRLTPRRARQLEDDTLWNEFDRPLSSYLGAKTLVANPDALHRHTTCEG